MNTLFKAVTHSQDQKSVIPFQNFIDTEHKILIEELELEMFIGILPKEKKEKQRVIIDLELYIDPKDNYEEKINNTISYADIIGVVSFYHYFRLEPKGEHTISICLGTACHVKGAGKILDELQGFLHIKEGETSKDNLFTLEAARCVGMCALAPVLIVDEKIYSNVKPSDVKNILVEYGFGG